MATEISVHRMSLHEQSTVAVHHHVPAHCTTAPPTGMRAIVRIEKHSRQQNRFKVMYGPPTEGW